jgi:hypothetical protein
MLEAGFHSLAETCLSRVLYYRTESKIIIFTIRLSQSKKKKVQAKLNHKNRQLNSKPCTKIDTLRKWA